MNLSDNPRKSFVFNRSGFCLGCSARNRRVDLLAAQHRMRLVPVFEVWSVRAVFILACFVPRFGLIYPLIYMKRVPLGATGGKLVGGQ
jgi:hypothetical protein